MEENEVSKKGAALAVSCMRCKKYISCNETCVYVDRILPVNSHTKEILTSDDNVLMRDYKEVLNELREVREMNKKINIGKIRQIKDIRLRAIASMIYSKISIFEIAALLDKSVSQIYRIVNSGASQA
ncbi:MAG: hypothetical protein HQK96_00585 [Nitrospirae bacterium]|nr:hypothetical protein [Nitrospirota bacterium]